MKVLYSGFDLCDAEQLGVDDDQRPGADDPRDVHQHRDRPAARQVPRTTTAASRPTTRRRRSARGRCPTVRGTVQADILKEDQGQNTCIFSTEFSLKVMGDIQQYFVHHNVRNFYSVSISGYHIAEAGANPISQLAFTLANGFTFVEAYLARGMHIDDFAPNLSFFFSYGMDPEYAVHRPRRAAHLGGGDARALRRQRAQPEAQVPLADVAAASLHAQEIAFNDIRTTLQALISTYDNTNSLHTNAYDEAITTPTEESVRRAMAIQLIINREWGLAQEREPEPGLVHHRRADRPRRGSGAEGVRGDLRARRRAGRDGDRLPARQDPGRVALLRAPEARRLAIRSSASTRSAIRTATRRRRRSSSPARPTTRSSRSSRACAISRRGTRARRRPRSSGCSAGGDRRRQRVRGADGARCACARSARSRTRCSRSAASTAAACRGPLRDDARRKAAQVAAKLLVECASTRGRPRRSDDVADHR